MRIDTTLQRLQAARLNGGGDDPRRLPSPAQPGFSDHFASAIDRVDALQKQASGQVQSFIAGETDNVHEIMITMNQAQLAFQFMTEVRNRMLDGYQELMRLQV